jgi:hypothetical protein
MPKVSGEIDEAAADGQETVVPEPAPVVRLR